MFNTNPVLTTTIIIFYILGFICAASAILRSRTPQGATAWIVGLLTMPFFTVPLYMIFGRSKFYGYTNKRKILDKEIGQKFKTMQEELLREEADPSLQTVFQSLSGLTRPGFTSKNKIELLIDAKKTYQSMFEELEFAEHYIIFQFYVFRADSIGYKFAEVLMRKAREGIKVTFLYDEIGSEIPTELIDEMTSSGMQVAQFNSLKGKGHFQINFRNHRKILIVDGRCAYVGGLNIGDDYLGLWPDLGPWRDTHVKICGPAVIPCQMAHAKDWYWCKQADLPVDWKIQPCHGTANVLILPTGPADDKQICLLAHLAMVNSAKERLWIANPYLVPPESLLDAIMLASLRGVDVRFIIPSYSDAWIVMIACQIYVRRLLQHGVKVYRYQEGFLHEKVMLVDNHFAVVGSANLDFRSMFINFEITVVAQDEAFVQKIEAMLERDFKHSRLLRMNEFENMTLWEKITARAANLLAPVL
jgi:cardiolipin synthase